MVVVLTRRKGGYMKVSIINSRTAEVVLVIEKAFSVSVYNGIIKVVYYEGTIDARVTVKYDANKYDVMAFDLI